MGIKYVIYKKRNSAGHCSLSHLLATGRRPMRRHYAPAWRGYEEPPAGRRDVQRLLEHLYTKYSLVPPEGDAAGRMQIGDIVSLKISRRERFFYCDAIGFSELASFEN